MKRAFVVAVILIGGFFGYRRFVVGGVEGKYEAFAEEILHRRYDAAVAMTDGLTARELSKLGSQERIGVGPPMFQTLFPSRFVINSRSDGPDGSVVLNATQTVLFNPVGVESTRPAMKATLKQVATLHNSGGQWKITAFENTFESMDTLSSR
jgi:hypothetical protein